MAAKLDIRNMSIEDLLEQEKILTGLGKNIGVDNKTNLILISKEIKKRKRKNEPENNSANVFVPDSVKDALKSAYIKIDNIIMPEYNDRSGIDDEKIKSLANSIKKVELIQDILVLEKENGLYEKLVGRRRILAHKLLERDKIRAKIIPKDTDKETIDLIIWFENMEREDLNLYDIIRFHIKKISEKFELKSEETVTFCNNVQYYKKTKSEDESNLEKIKKLEELLEHLGHFNTVSSLCASFPILKMSQQLIDALTQNNITFKLAKLLHAQGKRIEDQFDSEKLDEVIQTVIKDEMSVSEAKSYIESLVKIQPTKTELKVKTFKSALNKLSNLFGSLSSKEQNEIQLIINNELNKYNKK